MENECSSRFPLSGDYKEMNDPRQLSSKGISSPSDIQLQVICAYILDIYQHEFVESWFIVSNYFLMEDLTQSADYPMAI